jgi:predicted dehydrogenase
MSPIKITIIGVGQMGYNHLRVLSNLRGIYINSIYDKDINRIRKISKKFKVAYSKDLKKSLKKSDAAIICTPTNSHLKFFSLASKYVKNIFIEKPVTGKISEINKIIKISKKEKINIQCGFVERFNSVTPILKNLIKNQKIMSMDFSRTNKVSERIVDIDVVKDLMIHDLDLTLYLNGAVSKVFATGKKKGASISHCLAVMKHKNGNISRLMASKVTHKKIRDIAISCKNKFIHADLLKREIKINKETKLVAAVDKPYRLSSNEENIEITPREALQEQLIKFISLCKNPKEKVPDLNDAKNALLLADKIKKTFI